MTVLVDSLQKLNPEDGGKVELYELEISAGTYVYFCNHISSGLTQIQFRNRFNPSIINTYIAIPVEFTGFEVSSDGAYSRPRAIFANVLSLFSDTIGVDNQNLVGKKLIRRITLEKYLYGNEKDSNPPYEYPIQIFVIDRIESESPISITFELANPFDLPTITVPRRSIISNACAWAYQGAGNDVVTKKGGCKWRKDSKVFKDNVSYDVFFTRLDQPLVPSGSYAGTFSSSATKDLIYKVSTSVARYNTDGSTTNTTLDAYYQAIKDTSNSPPHADYRRCFDYLPEWEDDVLYYSYTDTTFNTRVKHNGYIYQIKFSNTGEEPGISTQYWSRVDICGKTLNSCSIRFNFKPASGGVPSNDQINKELPYGGFPASRAFNN